MIFIGARSSLLSQAQVKEVTDLLPHVTFKAIFVETRGDKDQTTLLRTLGKDDFFTREVDEMLLSGRCRIAVHSAKDLPEPLPKGLSIVALTEGLDSSDSLVFNEELSAGLPLGATIGTSCERRERQVKAYRSDLKCVDIRGTIEKRLALLDQKKLQGVVIAEAALIRLGLTHRHRVKLKGKTTPLQGKLAILAREEDVEMQQLFLPLDVRKRKVLYLGLDPAHYQGAGIVTHCPMIEVVPRAFELESLQPFTHVIFTSKSAVTFFFQKFSHLAGKCVIAIGEVTAFYLSARGVVPDYIAEEETQEGVISLLEMLSLKDAYFLWPRSSLARPHLENYLKEKEMRYLTLDIYDTFPSQHPLPDLTLFDEIVFTSPSTIDSFFQKKPHLPEGVKIRTIGSVTSNALLNIIIRKPFI